MNTSYQWRSDIANDLWFNQTAVDVQGIESNANVWNVLGYISITINFRLFESKNISQLRRHCDVFDFFRATFANHTLDSLIKVEIETGFDIFQMRLNYI